MQIFYFLFSIAISFLFQECKNPSTNSEKVQQGIIDLRNFKFHSNEAIQLDGQWEIYWNQSYASFQTFLEPSPEFIQVPGTWKNKFSSSGKALYKIKILTKEENFLFGLKIYEFPQAYRIYINRKLYHENGKYSEDLNQLKRSLTRPILFFQNKNNDEIEIIIEVASLNEFNPGPRRSILFGSYESILNIQENQMITDMIICGVLLIMGVYHIGLYYQRRKVKGALLFGIYCLVMTFRIFVTEEHYLHKEFPNFPDWLEWRLDVLSFYLLPPIISAIFADFFQRDYNKIFRKYSLALFGILILIYFFYPTEELFTLYIFFSSITAIYLCYVLYKGVRNKRKGSIIFLIGWVIYISTVFSDFLSYEGITRTIYTSHIGFVFFIFSQAYFLSNRFNQALFKAEELTETLESKVKERTQELNNTLNIIQRDIQLAKKIQESLLQKKEHKFPSLRIIEKYLPVAEVGGDIYDIREVKPNYFRIFIADATGHGIQAAFLTMMIKSEYDTMNHQEFLPNEILKSFNNSYTTKYKDLVYFFSCFILDIDLKLNKGIYSAAGHPEQILLRNKNIIKLFAKGSIIGLKLESEYFNQTIEIQNLDRFFLFTDGLFEEFNIEGEEFGELELYKQIQYLSTENIQSQVELILNSLFQFMGKISREDDITLLGVEVNSELE